jgi:hypothetical protein
MTLTKEPPVLSSERATYMAKTKTVKHEVISGHESQMGLDTETD